MVNNKRIVLDIDGVLANWHQAFIDKAKELGLAEFFPNSWSDINEWIFAEREKLDEVWNTIECDVDFWLNIKPMDGARESLHITPIAYVTARPIAAEVTKQWLNTNGFPEAPVYTIEVTASKLERLQFLGADAIVDDKLDHCLEAQAAGIEGILFDHPANRKFSDYPNRIYSLSELGE
jgi:uncharacterized HAD superfamily protein